jgi:dihydrofolate reductase
MRKITAGMFVALDGVVEAPDQWHFPYFNDEMGQAVDAQLGAADTILLGRQTYDSFAGAWPDREAEGGEDADFAKKLGDARKIVVSNQNLEFTWRNSEQLKGDLVDAVTALKREPGGDIGMSGSVSVVRQLLSASGSSGHPWNIAMNAASISYISTPRAEAACDASWADSVHTNATLAPESSR